MGRSNKSCQKTFPQAFYMRMLLVILLSFSSGLCWAINNKTIFLPKNFEELEEEADLKLNQCLKLFDAIKSMDLEKVRDLITKEILSPNCQDTTGNNPLHIWAQNSESMSADFPIFQVLLPYTINQSRQANKGKQNFAGYTPLMLAIAHENFMKAQILLNLEHGENTVNIDATNNAGMTALHLACLKKNAPLVKTLLANLANPNIPSVNFRNTPLHISCFLQDRNIIDLLLDFGADPNLTNSLNDRPSDFLKLSRQEVDFSRIVSKDS